MTWTVLDKFWHQRLKRPYILARPVDNQSGDDTVVLLHGIGRSGQVWQHVVSGLANQGLRVVAFDLLGFGASPKPKWPTYNVDDHAAAVIASLEKLPPTGQLVLVGHSMGCLVAVRVAYRRPDMVKHLVLYEMPLYEGLPHKRSYRLRTDIYYRFYRRIMRLNPTFSAANVRLVDRLTRKIIGQEVTAETWQPFIRSLENTIMNQTAAADIKQLPMPMDVIYGRFDMLVIRGQPQHIFGVDNQQITSHTIRASHVISPKASQFLVTRIMAALDRAAKPLTITDKTNG